VGLASDAVSDSVPPIAGEDVLATAQAGPAAVRGGALRVGGYLLGVALSVVSAALLFRHLGVKDGGRYVTVITLVVLFGGLTEAGLASIAVRELSAERGMNRRELMRDVVGLRLALSVVSALAAVAFAAVVGYSRVMVEGTALAALGMIVQSVQVTWSAGLMAQLRFGWVAALDFLRQLVTVIGIVLVVAVGGGLLSFYVLAIPAALAAFVPTAMLVRGEVPLTPRFDRAVWRRLLRDVLPFAAATAVASVYLRVTLILVSLLTDDTHTGYFGASFRVIEVLFVVPALAVGAAFPILSRAATEDSDRLRVAVERVAEVSAILGALVVLVVFVGAPGIVDVVAGHEFAPAGDVLRIQCLGLLGSFLAAVWGFGLLSLARHRALLLLACGPLVVNIVLTAILASSHGARGAAIATTIGELVLATAGALTLARAMRPKTLRLGVVVRPLLLAVPAGALALVDGAPTLLLAALACLAYVGLLAAAGPLPWHLIADLRGARRPA
jgi:O-antigen/teichoic acid export membrane protein